MSQIYNLSTWHNPYNRKQEINPLFSSHFIVKWEDNKYLKSPSHTNDIRWDQSSGIYLLADKKTSIEVLGLLQQYMDLSRAVDVPFRFSLFQSLNSDLALIIGDGLYEQMEYDFFELLNNTKCAWDGIGIHGHNCSAIDNIMQFSTTNEEEPLKEQLIKQIERYRHFKPLVADTIE